MYIVFTFILNLENVNLQPDTWKEDVVVSQILHSEIQDSLLSVEERSGCSVSWK